MLTDFTLKRFLPAIRYDIRAYLPRLAILAAFQNAHDHRLVFSVRASDLAGADILMHVASFLADEGFVRLDFAGHFIRRCASE
jgi:hypothetical protein